MKRLFKKSSHSRCYSCLHRRYWPAALQTGNVRIVGGVYHQKDGSVDWRLPLSLQESLR